MIVKAKNSGKIHENCYGDYLGCTVEVKIQTDWHWKARHANGYWWVTRKGGVTLRLTDAAFYRLFEEVKNGHAS